MRNRLLFLLVMLSCLGATPAPAQSAADLRERFKTPPDAARPWVFWYWMNGAVTREGISADLKAMREIGLEGAYLMPIRDSSRTKFMNNSVLQGTPEWWNMVGFAMQEADRLGLKMGLHVSDGFALAGGPWITPEHSMQKVVSTWTVVAGADSLDVHLPQPETNEGYYEDIAVLALPLPERMAWRGPLDRLPDRIRVSSGENAERLPLGTGRVRAAEPIWIQYEYNEPYTARSLTVAPSGTNHQALRWTVQCSDDGQQFRTVKTCTPPRSGWQDSDAPDTYSLPETTARYFRFCWTPEGTEPGAEDLDAAKWKPELSVRLLRLSGLPLIENYEGKSGLVWRLSRRQDSQDVPADLCFDPELTYDITGSMEQDGWLRGISLDPGHEWMVVRIGHTSTGHRNDTGGGAKGLECDKFDPEAVRCQFDHWFGAAYDNIDPLLLGRTLVRLHSDSWECGSQNWSARFPDEFRARRGYDLYPYLLVYTGLPVGSVELSESVLYDIRLTVTELVNEAFFGTLHELAAAHGCEFSSECVAPTMLSDGLLHYSSVDLPMGEFWYDSPTHDKPNDMLDAISGAHIYGKNIVQAEGFTQLRALWKEYPGMLKSLGDRNLALGMNKLFFHVFAHNPFPDKHPGMTLDGIGLFMQGGQTWWPYAGAWVDYFRRCQALLQWGDPVTDIAVFTGEELPSRSVLPDRLVGSLPGLFGASRVMDEKDRVANAGQKVKTTSVGVTASANMVTADLWADPLRGYHYDCINCDALLRLARAENGRMVLPGGASYRVLVLPMAHQMHPDTGYMSPELLDKIEELQQGGVVVLLPRERPSAPLSHASDVNPAAYAAQVDRIWSQAASNGSLLPFNSNDFYAFGLIRDIQFKDAVGRLLSNEIAWNHRRQGSTDLWFVSNQSGAPIQAEVLLRGRPGVPLQWWNPLNGEIRELPYTLSQDNLLRFTLPLEGDGSCFLVQDPMLPEEEYNLELEVKEMQWTDKGWTARLGDRSNFSGMGDFRRWDTRGEAGAARYYGGTGVYTRTFRVILPVRYQRVWLELDEVDVIARVRLNGQDCGVIWTRPYRVDITDAIKQGNNVLEVEVANTWYNHSQAVYHGVVKDDGWWTDARKWDFREDSSISEVELQPSGLGGTMHLYYMDKPTERIIDKIRRR